ncbi:hypothetical protein RQP46_003810 [Phenoliferia psychrophenolica]
MSSLEPPSAPPQDWVFASPDGNVRLVGTLVDPDALLVEGALFNLAPGGLYIAHSTLVTITSSPTSQTLRSLNSGTEILSLAISPSSPVLPTPSLSEPTLISLHLPLLTPSRLALLTSSPLWSTTFSILLDGPGFPPPAFDPLAVPPPAPTNLGSPSLNPTLFSPSARALLSPLLSPQRRADSKGASDASIPPLNLGLSRTRRSSSLSRPSQPASGLHALVPPPTPGALAAVVHDSITGNAKHTAEEIMSLRRAHEQFVLRAKAEADVLERRIEGGVAAHGTGRARATVVVRGFGVAETSSSRSRERPSGAGGEDSSRGRRMEVGSARDEEASRMLLAEDDARGRSRSRTRRGEQPEYSSFADVSAATTHHQQPGTEIKATIDEDGDGVEIPDRPLKDGETQVESAAASFVPSSHALVSIPESEELALPALVPLPTENGRESNGVEAGMADLDLDDEEEEEDAPFDMDEDIEIDDDPNADIPDLPSPPRSPSPPPPKELNGTTATNGTPIKNGIAAPSKPIGSQSYRPSSYRPSVLSSSYAALLSSSLAKHSAFATFPSPTPHSPPDTPHGAQTSVKTDILISASYVPPPSSSALREGEQLMRRTLALDAPSHRAPLPLRRNKARPVHPDADSNNNHEEEEEEEDTTTTAPDRFVVGSLPIAMPASRLARAATVAPERELERKTSVPAREGMFVPPLRRRSVVQATTIPTSTPAPAPTVQLPFAPASVQSQPHPNLSSSLAQSLMNPPPSFGGRAAMQEESEEDEDEDEGRGGNGEPAFVPPHVWSQETMSEEDMLSRSIPRS